MLLKRRKGEMKKIPWIALSFACLFVGVCTEGVAFENNTERAQQEGSFVGVLALEIRQKDGQTHLLPSRNDTLYVRIEGFQNGNAGMSAAQPRYEQDGDRLILRVPDGGSFEGASRRRVTVQVPACVEKIKVKNRGDVQAEGLTVRSLELVSTRGKVDPGDCCGWEKVHISSRE